MPQIIRIDDVSSNTDLAKLFEILKMISALPGSRTILLGVSPLVFDMSYCEGRATERVFPSILNAYSDHRVFMKVDKAGVPAEIFNLRSTPGIEMASHGLIHVDHRLLSREAQELSILVSCSLVASKIFVPPFNKWNSETQKICDEFGIELIRFEDGWKHLGYNRFDPFEPSNFYFHTHDFGLEDFRAMFGYEG